MVCCSGEALNSATPASCGPASDTASKRTGAVMSFRLPCGFAMMVPATTMKPVEEPTCAVLSGGACST